MGRVTRGVRGMTLEDDDVVIGMEVINPQTGLIDDLHRNRKRLRQAAPIWTSTACRAVAAKDHHHQDHRAQRLCG
ncbi:MAG: hypothetical protein M0C28_21320 [Candidatus Moduliflexus flocculans]|nr:hypothetical protein [Candidatus Moduliflexus flocculans]